MIHLSTVDGALWIYLACPKDFFRYMDSVGRHNRLRLPCSLLSLGEVAFGSTAGATTRLLGPAGILLGMGFPNSLAT